MKKLMAFFKEEKGGAIPEYALILGVIAGVTVAILITLGTQAQSIFTAISTKLGQAITSMGAG
jgi:Flp pilus assembly pilin Flp